MGRPAEADICALELGLRVLLRRQVDLAFRLRRDLIFAGRTELRDQFFNVEDAVEDGLLDRLGGGY